MKIWHYILLACLFVGGCSSNAAATPAATITPVPTVKVESEKVTTASPVPTAVAATPLEPVPTAEVEQQLQALWDRVDQGSSPSISWSPAYSVLFPSEWPPTSGTTWVRYAYAQGMDMDLHDAVRVSAPWARLELHGNSDMVTIVPLNAKLEPVTTQGVQPIDESIQATLAKEVAVKAYCLQLTTLPQPNNPQSAEVRTFYRTWLESNGALVDLIRSNHTGFLDWVNE